MQLNNLKDVMGVSADDILDESVDLLIDREWNGITRDGVKVNLEESLYHKDEIMMQMRTNPYYNGNLQLIMPIKIKRSISISGAKDCLYNMDNTICNLDTRRDLNGKTALDIINESNCKKYITIDDICNDRTRTIADYLRSHFETYVQSKDSIQTINRMSSALCTIKNELSERISERVACDLNIIFELEKNKFVAGQKTSKVVNRILRMYGDFQRDFNDDFTNFGNLINECDTDAYFVVSVNFLDYLRMSDGVSWASCHTTDYKNKRNMPGNYSGAWVQGTLSYANDDVSVVSYIVEKNKTDNKHPDRTPKLYRCMFHISKDNKQIIQGRVYPKSNDGDVDLYNLIYEYFMKIMGFNASEYRKIGSAQSYANTYTKGANYRDYIEYSDPTLFLANGRMNTQMCIGAVAYSCANGEELDVDDHGTII